MNAQNSTDILSDSLQLAHALADEARTLALRHFRTRLDVSIKADDSPVTIADREIEAALRARLAALRPADGIFGEEQGREHLDADHVWVIDPIDGTKSFITGSPLWGTLLALLHKGRPVLGMIDIPFTGERWWAVKGGAARYQDGVARSSGCEVLAAARLYATSPDVFAGDDLRRFERVSTAVALRRYGGDCYSYGLLASGHVDLVVEAGLQPYDYLSLVTIIEGAGGVVTDWQGRPLGLDSDGRVVAAATPALHAAALALLQA